MRNFNGMTIENTHHTLPDGMIGEVVTGDGSCLVLKKTIFDIISLYFPRQCRLLSQSEKRDFRSRNKIDIFNLYPPPCFIW